VNPESTTLPHQRSQLELSLESSKKSIDELGELLATSDLSLIVSSIKNQLLFLERSISSALLSSPAPSTSTSRSPALLTSPAPSTSTSRSPALLTSPAPSTSTSSSSALLSNPALHSSPTHLQIPPVLKLPEAFARTSNHRNYKKRNYGGMTSDELMNDYAEYHGNKKKSEEEKQERKRQRLLKAEIANKLKTMKRENENPKQKSKRLSSKQKKTR
jgi:hypothetical protein